MAGLGIQNAINNAVNTTTEMTTLHELFMDRYNEFYQKQGILKQTATELKGRNDPVGNMVADEALKGTTTPKVKSIGDRLNQKQKIANQTAGIDQWQGQVNTQLDRLNDAEVKAQQAMAAKLKEKGTARARRPQPTADPVERGMNFD